MCFEVITAKKMDFGFLIFKCNIWNKVLSVWKNLLPPTSCFYTEYDMIYLLTAIGLSPGGSSTVHIYTQTIHRTIQNNQYIEQHSNWRVRAVRRLG
jgi:uncharacterized integral membrane protein